MARSKLTQKAVSPLCVSPDESIFSLAGPFVKKRTSTTATPTHPQQQSLKNMKVILTHTDVDVDGMGNIKIWIINTNANLFSFGVFSVEGGMAILQFVFSSANC